MATDDRRSTWFKPEHANSALLAACAVANFTADQALDELAKRCADLERLLARAIERGGAPAISVAYDDALKLAAADVAIRARGR